MKWPIYRVDPFRNEYFIIAKFMDNYSGRFVDKDITDITFNGNYEIKTEREAIQILKSKGMRRISPPKGFCNKAKYFCPK